ncbi:MULTISPECIES: NucA/NucB deoxyribonuclease domain-containing protein [Thermomonospora]|uniref:Deoxyribonuclease NucA/NucB domain-containing protein n=1 Tax=Thermomonospora curvata (strain ATCC 19995 / DSM 43183 / JCM 3096 / KCTC 9072 / NBRC 15933 / NCIMB 10081 / Henssen B9) TaxID=471852 RepID=D1A2U8_THECD|nr:MULTISPECIES: NucA/NucB deoxyribonuclease domain-containing protein [Thermomonospora]ACY97896.1 hypothetical protein Tcur_2330 [Thermomonospora curvata DSM 43183]
MWLRRLRCFLLLAISVPIMLVPAALGPAASAAARNAPDPGKTSKPVPDAGRKPPKIPGALVQRVELGGDPPAPFEEKKRKPLTPDRAREEARRIASRHGEVSKYDTSKVKVTDEPPRVKRAPDVPDEEQVRSCLSDDAAPRPTGHVVNRWFWCRKQKLQVIYYRWVGARIVYQGSNVVSYEEAGYGRNDERGIRVFFRVTDVDYQDWSLWDLLFTAPNLTLSVRADCSESFTYCHAAPGDAAIPYAAWPNVGWMRWDIYSHESAGNGADKVLYHRWRDRFDGSSNGYIGLPVYGPEVLIRCDSATYFNQGQASYPKACVYYSVIPHLTYSLSDPRIERVAAHIYAAQQLPDSTYPLATGKRIPGKYIGTTSPGTALHRIPYDGPAWRANSAEKDRACLRRPPYQETGPPPPDDPSWQCDEYPFASTKEGAASPDWDFSVRYVPPSHNSTAGTLLRLYYLNDRILYDQDDFYVEIAN